MGALPVLAPDGGYKFSKTYRFDTGFGSNYWRTRIPHFGRGSLAQCARGIPIVVGPVMVKSNAYQAELAKKHDYLPARKG